LPEKSARTNLRKTLSRLKHHLSPFLNISRETIAFNLDAPYLLDVAEFEANVTNGTNINIRRLRESISLYKGDFLEGFDLPNALLFDEWVQTQRARLREIALDGLHALVDHCMDHKDYDSGITFARKLVRIEPWQEEAHRALMFMLASSGQRSAALKQYEECQRILEEELGVEPSLPTVKLFEKIQQDEIVSEVADDYSSVSSIKSPLLDKLGKPSVSLLPPLATPLIGRQQELKDINGHLLGPNVRLVTIAGLGGIGKTHLALTISHQLKERGEFQDGVFFVPLSSVTSHSRLLSAIAESLGLALTGIRQPEEALIDSLQNRVCLLVLDNFDQLLPEVDFLVSVLQVATQIKLLVTSRERLKLREEWVQDLTGLPYPDTIQEAQTSDYDAILLFSERARQIRSNFSIEKEISGVVRVCQLTQGMPLALEQAASLIRVHSANEIADQIEERLGILSTTLHNLPERHRSMRAVLDESWRWLSDEEQMVFCQLSVFKGGFTREAAEQVADASLPTLTALVDKSLIQTIVGHSKTTRYELHELVRQYAAECLLQTGQPKVAQAHEVHFNYYHSLAKRVEGEWLEHLEAERGNLHSALQWATEQKSAKYALRLNATLLRFWLYNTPPDEAMGWLEQSLSMDWDKGSQTTIRDRARVLIFTGYTALYSSDFKNAETRFQEGAELCSKLGDQNNVAWALRGSGLICLIQGNLVEAQEFMQKSWDICQELQSEYALAWAAYGLGNVEIARAELVTAESLVEGALAYFRQDRKWLGLFHSLISFGHLMRAQGIIPQAISCYKEALSIQGKTRYIHYVAQILEGLAHIAVAEDNMEVAVKLFGIAQARRDKFEMIRWAHHETEYQKSLTLTRKQLSESDWQSAWDQGYAMASQQGLEFALDTIKTWVLL
jgi:predicted ATPase/DNA-binding SARP family transcriptional activator